MEDPEGTPAEVGSGPAESDSNLQQPSVIETNTVKYFLGGASSPDCLHDCHGADPISLLTKTVRPCRPVMGYRRR